MKWISMTLVVAAVLGLATLGAQDLDVELQRAIQKEVASGNLKAAIADYQAIMKRAGGNDAVAAQALLRMADAHRKLGNAEARRIYEDVERRFPQQKDAVAQARAGLAALDTPIATAKGPRLRQVALGIDGMGAPSADGRYLSYTDWDTGDLVVRDLVTNTDRRLTKTGGWDASGDFAEFSVMSPDATQVVYAWWNDRAPRRKYDLRLVTVGNGKPRILHSIDTLDWIQPLQWSEGGRSVLALRKLKGDRNEIVSITVADGAVRLIKTFGSVGVDRATLSPDGRYLAYTAAFDKTTGRDIRVLDLQQQTDAIVTTGPADDRDVFWAPDGASLVFMSDRTGTSLLWRQPMSSGRPVGTAERLSTETASQLMGVTSNGGLFVVKGRNPQNVYLADLDAEGRAVSKSVLSERHLDFNRGAEWSPDGRRVAFYSTKGSSGFGPGTVVVVVRDMQTGEQTEIGVPFEVPPGPAAGLRWFPDGKSVLTVARRRRDGGSGSARTSLGYFRLDLATGQATAVYEPPGTRQAINRPDLSRDGRTLFFVEGAVVDDQFEHNQLIRLDVATGEKQVLRTGWLGAIALSPDGSQLAFVGAQERRAKTAQVGTIAVTGGPQRILLDSVWDPQARLGSLGWSRDGRHVIFANREKSGAPVEFFRLGIEGGEPQKIGVALTGQLKAPSVSPDGRRLVYTGIENKPAEVWVFDNLLPLKGDARK